MKTIYQSLSGQVAEGTFFRKFPVYRNSILYHDSINLSAPTSFVWEYGPNAFSDTVTQQPFFFLVFQNDEYFNLQKHIEENPQRVMFVICSLKWPISGNNVDPLLGFLRINIHVPIVKI